MLKPAADGVIVGSHLVRLLEKGDFCGRSAMKCALLSGALND